MKHEKIEALIMTDIITGNWSDRDYSAEVSPEAKSVETEESENDNPFPWWRWIFVASFIFVACILYRCIEAWKYGTWDSRRILRIRQRRELELKRKSPAKKDWFEEHMGFWIFIGFPVALFIIFPMFWDQILEPFLDWLLPTTYEE